MGDAEALAGGHRGEVAVELIAWSESDGVDDDVQAVPVLAQGGEHRFDLAVVGHVWEAQLRPRAPATGELLHPAPELVVLVGEGQFGAFPVHGGGDAGSDGELAGDSDDQARFPVRNPMVRSLSATQFSALAGAMKAASSNCCV